MSTAMDIAYCCNRAEECLSNARRAPDRDRRYAWHVLAAAWIDYAEAASEQTTVSGNLPIAADELELEGAKGVKTLPAK